ncbi:MAG: hypothetical protein J6Y09_04925 [Lachnospiraceae bacterium]|nr:hypothetical protein [Lachnospiraceae bacterium]
MTVKLDDSDRQVVLRYLGYRGNEITNVVKEKLEAAFNICNKIINVRQVWKLYSIRESKEGISLEEADCVLYGESLKKLLKGLNEAILFCVTIGIDFDREVEKQMIKDPTLGVCLNACGIAAIEKACDNLQLEVEKELGKKTTTRFSPGYGDLPLESQRDFIRLLNTEKIAGVRLNENNLMNPLKSVTAIAGLMEE